MISVVESSSSKRSGLPRAAKANATLKPRSSNSKSSAIPSPPPLTNDNNSNNNKTSNVLSIFSPPLVPTSLPSVNNGPTAGTISSVENDLLPEDDLMLDEVPNDCYFNEAEAEVHIVISSDSILSIYYRKRIHDYLSIDLLKNISIIVRPIVLSINKICLSLLLKLFCTWYVIECHEALGRV
jgi:hypothetical protein